MLPVMLKNAQRMYHCKLGPFQKVFFVTYKDPCGYPATKKPETDCLICANNKNAHFPQAATA
jgi:hypothetical protein